MELPDLQRLVACVTPQNSGGYIQRRVPGPRTSCLSSLATVQKNRTQDTAYGSDIHVSMSGYPSPLPLACTGLSSFQNPPTAKDARSPRWDCGRTASGRPREASREISDWPATSEFPPRRASARASLVRTWALVVREPCRLDSGIFIPKSPIFA